MIRANNYATAGEYLTLLQQQLQKLIITVIATAVLLLSTIATTITIHHPHPSLFALAWIILEWVNLGRLVKWKNKIRNYPIPTQFAAKQWRKQCWDFFLSWRYLKIIGILLCLLTFVENSQQLTFSWQCLLSLLCLLLFICASFTAVILANRILRSLRCSFCPMQTSFVFSTTS